MIYHTLKKLFNIPPRKHILTQGKNYLCINNKIGDFTVGKIYYCNQTNYLDDDKGTSDAYGEYKHFWKCFKEI